MINTVVVFYELHEDGSFTRYGYDATSSPSFKPQDKIILAKSAPGVVAVPLGGVATHIIKKCHPPIFLYNEREQSEQSEQPQKGKLIKAVVYFFQVEPISNSAKEESSDES